VRAARLGSSPVPLAELTQTVREALVLSCTARLGPLYYWRALRALDAQSKKEGVWGPERQGSGGRVVPLRR